MAAKRFQGNGGHYGSMLKTAGRGMCAGCGNTNEGMRNQAARRRRR